MRHMPLFLLWLGAARDTFLDAPGGLEDERFIVSGNNVTYSKHLTLLETNSKKHLFSWTVGPPSWSDPKCQLDYTGCQDPRSFQNHLKNMKLWLWYTCWWFKNPKRITWNVENPANNGTNFHSWISEPSTVLIGFQVSKYALYIFIYYSVSTQYLSRVSTTQSTCRCSQVSEPSSSFPRPSLMPRVF